jgi:hypothetical protein
VGSVELFLAGSQLDEIHDARPFGSGSRLRGPGIQGWNI